MEGMRFLLLDKNGVPANNGIIVQRVSDDKFLCTFFRTPQTSRLVHTDEIMGWQLFPNDAQLNSFIESLNERRQAQAKPPAQPPADKKKVAKKKRASKKRDSSVKS